VIDMKHLIILTGTLLLLSFLSYGLDPPVKLWEEWYSFPNHSGCFFNDIEVTSSGNLFITGASTDFSNPDTIGYCAFLLDPDGNVLWTVDYTRYSMFGQDGVILPDGSMAITGYGQSAYGSSRELFLMKINQDGSSAWTRVFDYPSTKEAGYSITCLPDGGFAVCGRVHGTGIGPGLAWILRTDADGDTLWTREWGASIENYGQTILFDDGELVVLTRGTDDTLTTQGPHMLFYDLDGNYLHGTDYPELYYIFPGDMCTASDSGFIFVTKTFPSISHTDQLGEIMWRHSIESNPNDENEGFCIRQTMDGGYLFSGWDGYFPGPLDEELSESDYPLGNQSPENTVDYKEGWLVRFDADGNELWNFNNVVSHDNFFYSCVQLPQGGYITGGTWGGSGYLVRYAPETGISSSDPTSFLTLEVSPNPFSSVLSASFSLPEENQVTLTLYDLYGRTVGGPMNGSYPGGASTIEWIAPSDLSSGCYFVRLNTYDESVTKSCVFIR